MTAKKQHSQLFFLFFCALSGFLLALGINFLLNHTLNKRTTDTKQTLFSPAPPSKKTDVTQNNKPLSYQFVTSYAPAINKASPAVVNIFTRKRVKQHKRFSNNKALQALLEQRNLTPKYKEEHNLGSGVIVSSQGHIITNNHVISGAQDIQILLKDGRYLQAVIVGRDLETDLALLKINAKQLPIIHFGDSSKLQTGDIVLAIGNPFGLGHTVTSGIISALNRSQFRANSFDNFIQTDAAINPGNSGGALVNIQGEMIGLNTINISNSGGSQGIGFAIPSSLVREVMYQLITYGEVHRGWIGIEAKELTTMLAQQLHSERQYGLLIMGVLQHGPAQKAGIQAGDIITHINHVKITSVKKALNVITKLRPGDIAILTGMRHNQSLQFKVIAEERPQMSGS